MHSILATTLLAPVAILPNFIIRPDYRRLRRYSPALIPAAVTAIHGHSFVGAFAFTVLVAVVVAPPVTRTRWTLAAAFALAIMIMADVDSVRPRGFIFKNALTAGQAMALLAVAMDMPVLAVAAGFTGTRSILLILAVALRRSWRSVFALILGICGFLAWYWLIPPETVSAERSDISGSLATRAALNSGWWQGWLGSGFGNFPGYQRPHNAFLGLWAHSGILSVPILATFAWHGRRLMRPRILLPLLPALFLGGWLFNTAGGIATLAVYFGLQQQRQRPEQSEGQPNTSTPG